jgi:hypothetical protein
MNNNKDSEEFRCDFCNFKFEDSSELEKHQIDSEHITIDENPDPLLVDEIKQEISVSYITPEYGEDEPKDELKEVEFLPEDIDVKVEISEHEEVDEVSKPEKSNSKVSKKVKKEEKIRKWVFL